MSKKRFVCIFVMVIMLFSTMGAGAFAEPVTGTEGQTDDQNVITEDQEIQSDVPEEQAEGPSSEATVEPLEGEAGEGEGGEGEGGEGVAEFPGENDGIVSIKTTRGYQRIKVEWTISEESTATQFEVKRYNYCTSKVDKRWTEEVVKDPVTGTVQTNYRFTDTDVGDGMMDSYYKTWHQKKGYFKYTITPQKLEPAENSGEPNMQTEGTEPEMVPVNGVAKETAKVMCVRTSYVTVTLKINKSLDSHQKSNNKSIYLKKGTKVYTTGFYSGKYVFIYKDHLYFLTRISTRNASTHYHIPTSYRDDEVTYFVNGSGISDNGKKYLIWVNMNTQRIYVLKESGGDWSIVKGKNSSKWYVSTGKASSPSIRTLDPKGISPKGVHTGYYDIQKKVRKRHNIPYWNCVSGFNAIHGSKWNWSKIKGKARSGGCIRNSNSQAKWIYNNCSKHTRVIIF